MKNIFNLLGIALITILIGTSCSKDSKKITRDDYLGTYTCVRYSSPDPSATNEKVFEMTVIAAGPGEDDILMKNFDSNYLNITARVDGGDLEITETGLPNEYITGSGTFKDGILSLDYIVPSYVYYGYYGDESHWTVTCTKQ